MISLTVDDSIVIKHMRKLPQQAGRAGEIALDRTARDVKQAIRDEMESVFDSPTRYTLNSLKITPTRNHNMEAKVWFKDPDRMGQHYLVPQVEGGPRKFKGFERAFEDTMFIPGAGARMTKAGNVSPGQIRQILSVLGKAERTAGYSANITSRSRRRNRRQRDYVYIPRKHGKLYPGIYERYQTGAGFGYKTKRHFVHGNRRYQKGRRRGRFASVIRARGLRPIMLVGRQQAKIQQRLDFYAISQQVHEDRFLRHYWSALDQILSR